MIWFEGFEGGDTYKNLRPLDFFVPEACAAFQLDGSPYPPVVYHYCIAGSSITCESAAPTAVK